MDGQDSEGRNVRKHDRHENLSPRQCPWGFPRLRLALFDRIERNPWWVPVARDRSRSNLSARVIALAGIPPLDRKKFSGRRVSQLITRRSWNSGCCEIRVIGNCNWLVSYFDYIPLFVYQTCLSICTFFRFSKWDDYSIRKFFTVFWRCSFASVILNCSSI